MRVVVREAIASDFDKWYSLWESYNSMGANVVSETVTQYTWERSLNPSSPLICRIAECDGEMAGFALCVLHEGTYYTAPVCYLEDFFVNADLRGKGIGRAVLDHLRGEAHEKGWAKVYWFTRATNAARQLYDKVAATDDFVRYRMIL